MKYFKFFLICAFALTINAQVNAQVAKYIGANGCKNCHNKPEKGAQYNQWVKTGHSKAFTQLEEKDRKNAECLKCHSTAGSVNKGLIASIKPDEGVSCESCHGPGSMYKMPNVMKNKQMALSKGMIEPTEATCKACHLGKRPDGHKEAKPWNFAEAKKKVSHPDPTIKK